MTDHATTADWTPIHEDRWVIETVARHLPPPVTPERVAEQLCRDVGRFYPHDMIAAVLAEATYVDPEGG